MLMADPLDLLVMLTLYYIYRYNAHGKDMMAKKPDFARLNGILVYAMIK